MMCRLVLTYFRTYEVVLTTRSFFFLCICYFLCHLSANILKWYQEYKNKEHFVCDPVCRVVRMSGGRIVYPDLDFRVHRLVKIPPGPPSICAVNHVAATVYIDLVICSYCDKTCHSADYCWKCLHDKKKLFKRIGATYIRLLTIGADTSVFAHLFL